MILEHIYNPNDVSKVLQEYKYIRDHHKIKDLYREGKSEQFPGS